MKRAVFKISLGPLLLLLLPVFLNGCTSQAQEYNMVSVDEDNVGYGEKLTFRFNNPTDQDIVVLTSGCSSEEENYLPTFFIEQQADQGWERAGAPICIAIATPPISLAPGENYRVKIPTSLGLESAQANSHFRYVFDIRKEIDGNYSSDSKIPREQRTSSIIEIVSGK